MAPCHGRLAASRRREAIQRRELQPSLQLNCSKSLRLPSSVPCAFQDVQTRLNLLQNTGAFSEALTQDVVEPDISSPHRTCNRVFRDTG